MSEGAYSDQAAIAIYQDLLDRITLSYQTGDFESYTRMFHLPHEVSFYGPRVTLETPEELRKLFDEICKYHQSSGITDYARTCLSARFTSPEEIEGAHETRLMLGSQVVEEPYPVKSFLKLVDGNWMVCASDNAVDPDKGVGRILKDNFKSSDGA